MWSSKSSLYHGGQISFQFSLYLTPSSLFGQTPLASVDHCCPISSVLPTKHLYPSNMTIILCCLIFPLSSLPFSSLPSSSLPLPLSRPPFSLPLSPVCTCACCIWLTRDCMLVGMRVGRSLSSTPFSGVPPASKMCPGVLGVEPGVVLSKWGGPGVRRALQLGVVAGWRGREVRNKGRSRRLVNNKIVISFCHHVPILHTLLQASHTCTFPMLPPPPPFPPSPLLPSLLTRTPSWGGCGEAFPPVSEPCVYSLFCDPLHISLGASHH